MNKEKNTSEIKQEMADKENYTCPICLYMLIEPVTLPCKHSLCMPCYVQTAEKSNLCCPLCRLRISVWARKASKNNTLIDHAKWEAIKKAFPAEVQKRLEGNESQEDIVDFNDDVEAQLRRLKELSHPGEIRKEYEAAAMQLQRQREEELKKEEEASAALIKILQQEEEEEMKHLQQWNEQAERDRKLAETLQDSLNMPEVNCRSLTVSMCASNKCQGTSGVQKKSSSTTPNSHSKRTHRTPTRVDKKGRNETVKAKNSKLKLTTFFSSVARGAQPVLSQQPSQSSSCTSNSDHGNSEGCGDSPELDVNLDFDFYNAGKTYLSSLKTQELNHVSLPGSKPCSSFTFCSTTNEAAGSSKRTCTVLPEESSHCRESYSSLISSHTAEISSTDKHDLPVVKRFQPEVTVCVNEVQDIHTSEPFLMSSHQEANVSREEHGKKFWSSSASPVALTETSEKKLMNNPGETCRENEICLPELDCLPYESGTYYKKDKFDEDSSDLADISRVDTDIESGKSDTQRIAKHKGSNVFHQSKTSVKSNNRADGRKKAKPSLVGQTTKSKMSILTWCSPCKPGSTSDKMTKVTSVQSDGTTKDLPVVEKVSIKRKRSSSQDNNHKNMNKKKIIKMSANHEGHESSSDKPHRNSWESVNKKTTDGTFQNIVDERESSTTQEDKDHLLAIQFQEWYDKLDRKRIAVDRFKGSQGQYELRHKKSN